MYQFLPPIHITWEESFRAALNIFLPALPDYTLVIGGNGRSSDSGYVELVSPDPLSNPIPNCKRNLGSSPSWTHVLDHKIGIAKGSTLAVGTTFGKLYRGH